MTLNVRRLTRRSPFDLLLLGWAVFILGVAWDLIYHAALFLVTTPISSSLDLLGSFGHVITFAGIVLIIFALLRHRAK